MPAALSPPAPALAALHRLNGPPEAPVAVALSGGGDSLALLFFAADWAAGAGRRLVALTVDHGLQPESRAWTAFARKAAERAGAAHRALTWTGPYPLAGLPAAAREARHALLAEAARAAGARVILTGHTADDLAEAELMRREGVRISSPRIWSPSPAWPEGRGLFLLRPLLGLTRADLRAHLVARGEAWIDDPANDDLRSARARARRRLAGAARLRPAASELASTAASALRSGPGGELRLPRTAVAALEGPALRRVVAALAVCAGGGARPPRRRAAERLAERVRSGPAFTASLAGARIEAGPEDLVFLREAGERLRSGDQASRLPKGELIFDGRFRVEAFRADCRIGWLAGRLARLSRRERDRLSSLPARARQAAPAVILPSGETTCPLAADGGPALAEAITFERALAALGAFRDEASLSRVAKGDQGA